MRHTPAVAACLFAVSAVLPARAHAPEDLSRETVSPPPDSPPIFPARPERLNFVAYQAWKKRRDALAGRSERDSLTKRGPFGPAVPWGSDGAPRGTATVWPEDGRVTFSARDKDAADGDDAFLARRPLRPLTLRARGREMRIAGVWRWDGGEGGRTLDVRDGGGFYLTLRVTGGKPPADVWVSLIGADGKETGGVRLSRMDRYWADGETHRVRVPLADLLREARGTDPAAVAGFALRAVSADADFALSLYDLGFSASSADHEERRDRLADRARAIARMRIRPGMSRAEVERVFLTRARPDYGYQFEWSPWHPVEEYDVGHGVSAYIRYDEADRVIVPVRIARRIEVF